MILYLAIKNIQARKSSVVIVAFIAFAIMLLCAVNAIFDSTENGVEETFIASFTGDVAIRAKSDVPLSLFGDETPVTGELTEITRVVPYDKITEIVSNLDETALFTSQVSGIAMMEAGGVREPQSLFGVEAQKYIEIMSSIKILEGAPFPSGERGLMLSKKLAEKYKVKVGDTVQFSVADGVSFRIRAVPLTAIYEYAVDSATLDRIVLIDAITLRQLLDISDTVKVSAEEEEAFLTDLADLFEGAEDIVVSTEDSLSGEELFTKSVAEEIKGEAESDSSMSWNFIIIKLHDGSKASSVIKRLNRTFKKMDYPAEAVNWRRSAGSAAMYLYWMRFILNAGILVVLFAGFIVINNTLVINVLDRIKEIGTMRAIGAQKRFVSSMCMAETLALCITAGIVGLLLGAVCTKIINNAHIALTNDFLRQLFGGSFVTAKITPFNVVRSFFTSVVLGLVAWIYPVSVALTTSPVEAMQGGK